jgi:hypothetical protein
LRNQPATSIVCSTTVLLLALVFDRQSMKWAFDLWSYDDVAANSTAILGKFHDGTMPCDGAWSDEQVAVFQRWVDAGRPA